MPGYDFICEKCDHNFEIFLPISDREKPLKEKCPSCGKTKCIVRNFAPRDSNGKVAVPGMSVDATLSPDKATHGHWSEWVRKVKKGLPERYHGNLDRATEMRGNG